MAGPGAFTIRTKHGQLEWDGFAVDAIASEASIRTINALSEKAATIAREEHVWESRTYQTENAVFWVEAVREEVGTTPASTPHVWGYWGVEDRPRTDDEERTSMFHPSPAYEAQYEKEYGGEIRPKSKTLTTLDVALFLEFGTVDMAARPWIYPAWDQVKMEYLPLLAATYRALAAMHWRPGMGERGPTGANVPFRSFASIGF